MKYVSIGGNSATGYTPLICRDRCSTSVVIVVVAACPVTGPASGVGCARAQLGKEIGWLWERVKVSVGLSVEDGVQGQRA